MWKQDANLWDDSTLINAFDDAMANYKKIHRNKTKEGPSSIQEGKVVSSTGEQIVNEVDETEDVKRQGDADDKRSETSKTYVEIGEISNLAEVKENQHVDFHVREPYPQVSQGVQHDYSYSQGSGDYTQILNQYYEVEEKRQKLLEQLHQFGSWNDHYYGEGSGSAVQTDTAFSSQQHAVPTCQPSNSNLVCSCCPYLCQCLMAPCTSIPTSLPGGSCVGRTCTDACLGTNHGKLLCLEDSESVKTAMGTAERALSSIKMQMSGDSNPSEETKGEKHEGEMAETTSSETDLTVVLNAWYFAGFHTGKYLTEQSVAKKRQG